VIGLYGKQIKTALISNAVWQDAAQDELENCYSADIAGVIINEVIDMLGETAPAYPPTPHQVAQFCVYWEAVKATLMNGRFYRPEKHRGKWLHQDELIPFKGCKLWPGSTSAARGRRAAPVTITLASLPQQQQRFLMLHGRQATEKQRKYGQWQIAAYAMAIPYPANADGRTYHAHHICEVPMCCAKDHLEWKESSENMGRCPEEEIERTKKLVKPLSTIGLRAAVAEYEGRNPLEACRIARATA